MSAVLICVPFVPIQADEGISDHYCWEIASNPRKSQPSCECHSWLDDIGQPNPRCESSGKFWDAYSYCEKVHYHHDGNNYNTWCDNNNTVQISYSHCVMRWNPLGIAGCALTITGCVVACGGVAFGWGIIGCLLCLAGEGVSCYPCVVRKCVAIVSKRETVSAWSGNGGTCPPDKHDGGY